MAASLLENGGVPNATTPETRINAKNQGESETDKVLFFNRPQRLPTQLPESSCKLPVRQPNVSKPMSSIKVPTNAGIGA
jgi:hypothetical protein